jgi:hypothetical protein
MRSDHARSEEAQINDEQAIQRPQCPAPRDPCTHGHVGANQLPDLILAKTSIPGLAGNLGQTGRHSRPEPVSTGPHLGDHRSCWSDDQGYSQHNGPHSWHALSLKHVLWVDQGEVFRGVGAGCF